MRILGSLAALALAVALILPLGLLPQTQAVEIIGGFWGMALGVGVLGVWAAIWS